MSASLELAMSWADLKLVIVLPDPAAPIDLGDPVRDGVGGVVLVAPHDLEDAVGVIGHGVEADELVGHGDGEEGRSDPLPMVDGFVVEVGPMEVVVRIEDAVGSRVREVPGLFGLHGHEDLDEGEDAGKKALA